MRSLAISTITLLVILTLWFGFMTYCEDTLNVLVDDISINIEPHVSSEEWRAAEEGFSRFSEDWHKDKSIYSFFLEQSAMLDTDFAIARAEAYIKAEDKAGAMGELACIREQLRFLFLNERINLENIL